MFRIMFHVLCSIDKHTKQPLFVTLLDVKTAFDVVWHDSLLRKLHGDGINPPE